ncbi:unnamed protein product [Arctia plantaginis]|uniref:Acyltransferase 3 domain-containing protein n=1 Tax=Arctia plantaginis TaxID=874455 RepID=A0A8S0YLA3_ARCPL|nr:unnamed protein product [Arctia plantaginis]
MTLNGDTQSSSGDPPSRLHEIKKYHNIPIPLLQAYDDPLKQLLFNGSLVTHTFFIMSSFLLAYNFMLHTEKHPIRWMHLPKGIILRWLRLTPPYALVLGTIVTWMRHMHQGPMWGLVVVSEADACRQYWWAQFLYINNYVYDDALCMPQTWYLAADTQLFCLGLLVCVLARTCKARVVTLTGLMVVALAIVAGQTYFQDLEAVVIQSPESYRNLYATNDTFRLLYARGHTNISTYVLGLAAGFLTYRWQNGKGLDKYKKYRWVSWVCFPLGVAVILSGGLMYRDEGRPPTSLRVLYATLYKPIFQMIVIGIIVPSVFKLENVYRGIIEWRGFTWTGRVSYSAFLLHTLFQRGLTGAQTSPTHMSDYYVITVLAASIFLSYLCAAILWLVLEAPAASLIRAALAPNNNKRDDEPQSKV